MPALAGILWLLISIFFSIHTVGQRQVGIVYNFSGTISGNSAKSPGVVTTWPWQNIRKENVSIQKDTFVFAGSDSAVSKDQQPITATIVVNYQVEPQHVASLYKSVGPNWKTVLLDVRVHRTSRRRPHSSHRRRSPSIGPRSGRSPSGGCATSSVSTTCESSMSS